MTVPGEPLDLLPLWALFVTTCVVALVVLEGGYRLGAWRHARAPDEKETPVGAMVASILGLLAFLLAFTFSMAASRFDARRQIVVEEANAIGTAYLRTRLLPEPHRTETARMLREYVEVRARGIEDNTTAEVIIRSKKLQELIWTEAVKAAQHKDANPVLTGMFIQALNEVIDVHAKRNFVGLRTRIPVSIWVSLLALAAISIAGVGYQAGLSATPRSPMMLALVFSFAGVLFLIADLDRSHAGFLTVSQEAMVDLQKSMPAQEP